MANEKFHLIIQPYICENNIRHLKVKSYWISQCKIIFFKFSSMGVPRTGVHIEKV